MRSHEYVSAIPAVAVLLLSACAHPLPGTIVARADSSFVYHLPPRVTLSLGSTQPGVTTTHQVGWDNFIGVLETYQATLTYPGAFGFNGFTALGPTNTQIGSYEVDFGFDGSVDFTIPLRVTNHDQAYADREPNGVFTPGLDATIVHTVQGGDHVFTVTLPSGGDGNAGNILGPSSERVTATLLAGILSNPTVPACYALTAGFTSVDPDTGDASNGAGQSPLTFTSSHLVRIGAPAASTSLLSAVLPGSRSVQVGATATAFVTIINAGAQPAASVGISLAGPAPVAFFYQRTDPLTNVPTGAPNTPADIPAGGSQSFVVALTPLAAMAPTDVEFNFCGPGGLPVGTVKGLNTLLLSASTTPIPDIVALAATLAGDGIVNVPGPTGTGVFAVATVNVGAGAAITATANTGGTALPTSLTICETNPTSGVCLAPPSSSVTTSINANATPTFGIFVQGTGDIPFNPAINRIFVNFQDTGGSTRGSTSVAVRTQ